MNPLRLLTPGQLVICLVLFFLPWIEIQCQVPDLNNPSRAQGAGWNTIVSQTGLQAAAGEQSLNPLVQQPVRSRTIIGEPPPAPVLWIYLVVVVLGILMGLGLPAGRERRFLLPLCCLVGVAVIATPLVMGFPIENKVREEIKRADAEQQKHAAATQELSDAILELAGEPKQRPNPPQQKPPSAGAGELVRTVYGIPLYLSLLFATGAFITALIEPLLNRRPSSPELDRRLEPPDDEPLAAKEEPEM